MRISDWSSDVCSSDLNAAQIVLDRRYADRPVAGPLDPSALARGGDEDRESLGRIAVAFAFAGREVARSAHPPIGVIFIDRSEEHTSDLQSIMSISYAVFCLKKKKIQHNYTINTTSKHLQ